MQRKLLSHKPLVLSVAAVGIVGLSATAAFAHATFTPSTAAANSDVVLTLRVPVERQGQHNVKVIVKVPDGFAQLRCEEKPEWTCSTSPRKDRTPALVTFTRQTGTGGDDDFRFGARTPQAGRYLFGVIQRYANGEDVFWEGPLDSDYPSAPLDVQ